MKKYFTDPKYVATYPMLATFLLEYANAGQLYRMWTEHSALGQELTSWLAVWLALVSFQQFYRICTPTMKFAIWGNRVGILLNSAVCMTVAYFRYFA